MSTYAPTQYFTPRSASRCCVSRILSLLYIVMAVLGLRHYRGKIGMIQRRGFAQPALDQCAQVVDHPVEGALTLGRAGDARRTSHTIGAGAIDRVREHQAGGAIGIIGLP